jgi:hypothetical protein
LTRGNKGAPFSIGCELCTMGFSWAPTLFEMTTHSSTVCDLDCRRMRQAYFIYTRCPGTLGMIARHLPLRDAPYPQPRPIILDTNMRTPLDCKLLQNYKNGTGMQPWIVCGKRKSFHGSSSPTETLRAERRDALEAAGAKVIEVDMNEKQSESNFHPTFSS